MSKRNGDIEQPIELLGCSADVQIIFNDAVIEPDEVARGMLPNIVDFARDARNNTVHLEGAFDSEQLTAILLTLNLDD